MGSIMYLIRDMRDLNNLSLAIIGRPGHREFYEKKELMFQGYHNQMVR